MLCLAGVVVNAEHIMASSVLLARVAGTNPVIRRRKLSDHLPEGYESIQREYGPLLDSGRYPRFGGRNENA